MAILGSRDPQIESGVIFSTPGNPLVPRGAQYDRFWVNFGFLGTSRVFLETFLGFLGIYLAFWGLSVALRGLLAGTFWGYGGPSWAFCGTFWDLLGGFLRFCPPPLSPLLPPFWAIKGHPTIMPCNYMRVCSFLSEPNNVTHVCSLELTSASRATICVSVHWN